MDKVFKEINPEQIDDNVFKLIGTDWMIITAADGMGGYNGMTASWGGCGVLWGRPVCFCFVRPQRYTFKYMELGENVTFSFFDESYRSALKLFGSRSGRDTDKAAVTGLTPVASDSGGVYYKEARLTLIARKLYADFLDEEKFTDRSLLSNYSGGDYHKMYVCEILQVLQPE